MCFIGRVCWSKVEWQGSNFVVGICFMLGDQVLEVLTVECICFDDLLFRLGGERGAAFMVRFEVLFCEC